MKKKVIEPALTPDIVRAIEDFLAEAETEGTVKWFQSVPEPGTGRIILMAEVV